MAHRLFVAKRHKKSRNISLGYRSQMLDDSQLARQSAGNRLQRERVFAIAVVPANPALRGTGPSHEEQAAAIAVPTDPIFRLHIYCR